MTTMNHEQRTPEWFASRRGLPTASRFSRIITPAKGDLSTQWIDLACELVSELLMGESMEDETLEKFASPAMRRGTEREAEARAWYEFENDVAVVESGLVLSKCGRFGCSPDGLIDTDGAIEIKCPEGKTHIRYIIEGELPKQYKPQVHSTLAITGRSYVDFMSYWPFCETFVIRQYPDEYTDKVKVAMDQFTEKYDGLLDRFGLSFSKSRQAIMESLSDADPLMIMAEAKE